MNLNAKTLALRDAAMAFAMGLGTSDFAGESTFGADFGYSFGVDPVTGVPVQTSVMPTNMAMLPANHPASPLHPANQAAMQSVWAEHMAKQQHTQVRTSLLDPNRNSTVKVERYSFTINATINALGTTQTGIMSDSPATSIRPQRVIFNAPSPGFLLLSDIKVGNVSGLIGAGAYEDAWSYSAQSVDSHLDLPLVLPSQKLSVPWNYTGFTPPGFPPNTAYTVTATFRGPATMAGANVPDM